MKNLYCSIIDFLVQVVLQKRLSFLKKIMTLSIIDFLEILFQRIRKQWNKKIREMNLNVLYCIKYIILFNGLSLFMSKISTLSQLISITVLETSEPSL